MSCSSLKCLATVVGYAALAYFAYAVTGFVYNHFFRKTDLAKYGAKRGGGAWALITGAREGIGKGFAQALASRGFNVILVARNKQGLVDVANEIEKKYNVKTVTISADATNPNSVQEIVEQVKNLELSVLVNNVGVNSQYPTVFTEMDLKEINDMITVNVSFTTQLTHALLPTLLKSKKGLVFLLSSFTGKVPTPMMSVYAATKAYNDMFARSLAGEYKSIDFVSVVPHYVVSVMSGIKRPSLMIPTGYDFAQLTLNQIGTTRSLAAHWAHDLMEKVVDVLPESYVAQKAFEKMKIVRKKLIARDERNKAKQQ